MPGRRWEDATSDYNQFASSSHLELTSLFTEPPIPFPLHLPTLPWPPFHFTRTHLPTDLTHAPVRLHSYPIYSNPPTPLSDDAAPYQWYSHRHSRRPSSFPHGLPCRINERTAATLIRFVYNLQGKKWVLIQQMMRVWKIYSAHMPALTWGTMISFQHYVISFNPWVKLPIANTNIMSKEKKQHQIGFQGVERLRITNGCEQDAGSYHHLLINDVL